MMENEKVKTADKTGTVCIDVRSSEYHYKLLEFTEYTSLKNRREILQKWVRKHNLHLYHHRITITPDINELAI